MPKRKASEKTRMDILETAGRLFSEKGWINVNVEDVVNELNLTRGAFYHHFKSREDLIYSVMILPMFENSPFVVFPKDRKFTGLEKLQYGLKTSLGNQLSVARMNDDMIKSMFHPVVMKNNILLSVNLWAEQIEKLLIEGNEDGSTFVAYPKHMAQTMTLIFNEWINPAIFQMSRDEFSERLLFLEQFGKQLGAPAVDEELKEMLLEIYERYKGSTDH